MNFFVGSSNLSKMGEKGLFGIKYYEALSMSFIDVPTQVLDLLLMSCLLRSSTSKDSAKYSGKWEWLLEGKFAVRS